MRKHNTERDGTERRRNGGPFGRGPDPQQSCVTGHRAARRAGPNGQIAMRTHVCRLPDDLHRSL